MKKTVFVLIICLLSAWATCGSPLQTHASQIPQLFTYEGKYVSPDGTPMPDGVYDLVFSLYEAQTGGSAVWTETHRRSDGNGVKVTQGNFKVALGKSIPLPNFSANYWLAVVDPTSGKELVPREELGSVPYALNGVPKGAIIIWRGTECPPGYARVGEFDGRFLRGADEYGATGGNETHTHTVTGTIGMPTATCKVDRTNEQTVADSNHTHSFSGTALETNHLPPYINVIFCEKE